MTNQVAIQLVNVRTLKIVKLLTFEAEDRVVHDHADMDAFAVEYIAVHDRPRLERPRGKGCACWAAIASQISGPGLFPLRLQPAACQLRLWPSQSGYPQTKSSDRL